MIINGLVYANLDGILVRAAWFQGYFI